MSVVDVKSLEREHAKIEARKRNERIIETARFMLAHNQGSDSTYIYAEVMRAFARARAFEDAANKLRRGEDV